MDEQDKEQRTEQPSGKRLQKAVEEGRVVRSPDLMFAVILLTAAYSLEYVGARMLDGFRRVLGAALFDLGTLDSTIDSVMPLTTLKECGLAVAPMILALFVLALALSFTQVGFHFVPQKLEFKPEKLQPKLALSTFVNAKSLLETGTSVFKLAALAIAAYVALNAPLRALATNTDPHAALRGALTMFVSLLKYLGGTLLVLGIFDWFFRHRQHINDLKMTKQEVKQENKDAQGDMEAKARIRGRQKQFAMQRMMAEVPKATAVVVNPTHFAVALRYESSMGAPVVVAKGRDHVALRIKAVAKENGVPVIENPPLARALHESARIGDEIPPTLYKAVAEMLAMIFRTDKRLARGERRVERRPA